MKFLGDRVSLVMNFICRRQARLDGIRINVPLIAKYLGDYPTLINYNNKTFLPDVSSLFQNAGIEKLHFQNDLDKMWAKVTLDLISMTDSPYILFLADDARPAEFLENNYFEKLVDEFEKYNCEHMLCGKISKYNTSYWDDHYHIKTKNLLICESDNSPFSDLPLDALMTRGFFIDNLKKVIDYKGHSGLVAFEHLLIRDDEGRGKSRVSKKITHCVPVKDVFYHAHC